MLLSLVTGILNSTETQSEFVQKSFLKLGLLSRKKKLMLIKYRSECGLFVH